MADKQYINGIFIAKYDFPKGGTILKCGIKVDELCKALQEIKKESGWANIIIAERRETSDKGQTHYAYVDTYEPRQATQSNDNLGLTKDEYDQEPADEEDDSLPF